MVQGNLDGLKASVKNTLTVLEEQTFPPEEFLPSDLLYKISEISASINREISVYLTRKGKIIDISVGDNKSVFLPPVNFRRSNNRLCGVRCVHTHPNASSALSDVDISALKDYRLDSIVSIGINNSIPMSIQAAFLSCADDGAVSVDKTELISCRRIPQSELMERIYIADKMISSFEDRPQAIDDLSLLIGITDQESLNELKSLAETAGAKVVGFSLQKRDKPDNTTYIGKGKAAELALTAQALNANLIIADDELTGVQIKNLETILGIRVIDRTAVILDIFAQRGASNAGKLQVEMAQLAYMLPRLINEENKLSRQGGGIGTRGPGETKLETDRRKIRKRISDLRHQLDELKQQRNTQRALREKNNMPVVALVGYTNVGKSTLLNALTSSDVLAKDELFATLDPVCKRAILPKGRSVLVVDTVGFVRKLPHTLIDAFRSTLEEAKYADILVIVNDASADDASEQREVVFRVLDEIGVCNKPYIDVCNKIDKGKNDSSIHGAIDLSATEGWGIDRLLEAIEEKLNEQQMIFDFSVPYDQYGALIGKIDSVSVHSTEYLENGVHIRASMSPDVFSVLNRKFNISLAQSTAQYMSDGFE